MLANSRLHFKSNINSFENQFLPRKQTALPGLLESPKSCSPAFKVSGAEPLLNAIFGKLLLPRLDATPAPQHPAVGLGAGQVGREAWAAPTWDLI